MAGYYGLLRVSPAALNCCACSGLVAPKWSRGTAKPLLRPMSLASVQTRLRWVLRLRAA